MANDSDNSNAEMFNEVFTRLRETEARTREQSVRLDNVAKEMATLSTVTDKFIAHLARQEERSERREQNFFKALSVLVGALVVMAVGPKVAKEFYTKIADGNTTTSYYSPCDIWYKDSDHRILPIKAEGLV